MISWPVMVFFTDWEIGLYENKEAFYETSGCEELDFEDDVEFITDLEGSLLVYNQNKHELIFTEDKLEKSYVLRKFCNYFEHLNKLDINISEFEEQASTLEIRELIAFANRQTN